MRVTIAGQINARGDGRIPGEDVVLHPRPEHKPRPDANWDEVAGRWEVWSDEHQGWVSLSDGTVQEPGTPSTDLPDGALPPPVAPPSSA